MENLDQILDAPVIQGQRLQYAGFWIRVGAYVVDAILLFIVQSLLLYAFGIDQIIVSVVSIVIGIGYFAVMESSENQGTLGKMAVGIKVGDENGKRIELPKAIGRYFAKILSGLILLIGFMMAGWDDKKQALHDKIMGTYVFYAK